MKKYFILAAAALVTLASCMKNNADTTTIEKSKVINFNTVANKATKAPISGTTYKYTDPAFGVFAWYLASGDWNTAAANSSAVAYMGSGTPLASPVEIRFDDSKDIWAPHNGSDAFVNYYWPLQGKLTFIAYSPKSAATATFSNAGVLTLTGFSVSTTVADQVDLLYSSIAADKTANDAAYTDNTDLENIKNSGSTTGVNIKFKHALAQVVFKAKTAADVYASGLSFKVNSITVNAVQTATSMTVTNPTDLQAAADITTWTIPGEPTKNNFLVNTSAFPNTTVAVEETAGDNFLTDDFSTGAIGSPLLMIPVKDNTDNDTDDAFDVTDPTVTIVYTLYRLDDAQPLGQKSVTVHFKTIDGTVKEWLAGKKYEYDLTIDLQKIYFNPTITNWVDGETQTATIPQA